MSTTIDERVVSMQFDNKQFESNVQTSLSTLDKLKQSLNLNGASKGLDNVSAAAKNVNFSGLSGAVDVIRTKFSALEVIGVTALANITNSAVNAGKRIAAAITIDPIKSGLSEYETQIGAIQTILANTQAKGTTLDDVNSALDELNQYADKTIYNFTEMTRNIGTFTAAGVGLNESVSAIKGIANLAAVSGSTSQQASTAMYQLSQALASGTVKLQDWNSVVNAGMGGEVFQTALKRTATQMGYNVDEMIEKYGSFRESLTQGEWLTKEVLTETLAQLSGAYTEADLIAQGYTEKQAKEIVELARTAESAATDVKTFTQLIDTTKEALQSGWTQTWEILIGDFEEAKELWSGVSEVLGGIINATAEARNKLLGGALSKSTWGEFTKKIEEAGFTTKDFEEAVRDTAKNHGKDIDSLIEKYGSFEKAVKAGAIETDILKESLKDFSKTTEKFNLDSVKRTLKTGVNGDDVTEVENALKALGYNLKGQDGVDYSGDGYFGSVTEAAIREFQKDHNLTITGTVDEATLNALKAASKEVKGLDDSLSDLVDGFANLGGREKIIDGIKDAFAGIKNIVAPLKDAFREIFPPSTAEHIFSIAEGFANMTANFKAWTESAAGKEVIADIASAFKGFFSVIDIGLSFVTSLASGIFKLLGSLLGFGGGIASIAGSIGDWLTGLRNSIKETNIFATVINGVVGVFQSAIDVIKKFFSYIGGKFSTPGFDGLASILGAVWNFIQKIGGAIARFGTAIGNVFMSGGFGELISLVNGGLLGGLLYNVINFVSGLKDGITDSFGGIGDILGSVKGILDGVGEALTAWTQNIKANIILKIAGAIGILAVALLLIASIEPAKLSSALTAITILFGELMLSLNLFSKTGIGEMRGVTKAVTSMIGISVAVLILASALKKISSLGWEELAKGLIGIVALTGTIVLAAKAMSSSDKQVMKGAAQMVIMAGALKILASVCEDLAQFSWEELGKGLIGVGVLMGEVALFMRYAKFDSKSIAAATGILLVSAAIKVLASACAVFGNMSWRDIGKGLGSVTVLLFELWAFTKLVNTSSGIISTGIALIAIGAAMKIFASAVTDLSTLSWNQLGVGLAGMAGALLAVTVAMRFMPKNLISTGVGLAAVAVSIGFLADALMTMGDMSWDSVGRSMVTLAGSMFILALALNAMKSTIAGSAALLVASAALAVLAPALKKLGDMSWESIGKGLIAIAGAFVILGVAGAVLGPLVPAILGLSGALALIGVATLAVGVGIFALGAGISALASGIAIGGTAIVAGIESILLTVIGLIPDMLIAFGEGLVGICTVIGDSAGAIGEAFTKVLLSLVDVFVECVPALAEGLLVLVDALLASLAEHTPSIVESVIKVLFGIFEGVANALKNIDGSVLLDGLIGIGVIAAIIAALSAITPLIPGALAGALGVGVIVAELAVVLAAIGALAQIPGLQWLVGEGGQFMQSIGNALGQFVGGIAGGIAEGFTASLPQIGTDLSTFMTNLQPFIDGASKIDSSLLEGVTTITGVILALTAANILEGLTSWFTGGSSLDKFGTELVSFGTSLASFSTSVTGVDATAVNTAISAAKNLIDVASGIPTSGGIISWFTGEQSMETFGSQLKSFGTGIKDFANAVVGIDAAAVTTAANAAKSLVEVSSGIPSSGGIVGWFTGEQDLSAFGGQLKSFGEGIKGFADSVIGLNAEAVTIGVNAAKTLTEVASTIPSSGGVISWFTGDQDLGTFSSKLGAFGSGIKAFADSVAGINAESVTAGINAGKSLVDTASLIPTTGGVVSWFTGDQDLAAFSSKLSSFGAGIKAFADSVAGINAESVTAGINAGKSLIETASLIPSTGGVVGWFTGDQDLASFGSKLGSFGAGVKSFADNVAGINAESVTAGITAAKSLIDTASLIPSSGGVVSWFTGEQDLASFGSQLGSFGVGVKAFADNVLGINSESVTAGITAAKSLLETATLIPTSGGIVSWFTGEQDLTSYSAQLGSFGAGIKAFADSVAGINCESVTTAANAASALINAAADIPATGGIVSWFTGEQNLETFGSQLGKFGEGIKSFADKVAGINTEAVTSASTAATELAGIASTMPDNDKVNRLGNFGNKLKTLGDKLKEFSTATTGVSWDNVTSAADSLTSLSSTLSSMPESFKGADSFSESLKKISKTSIDDFVKAFTNAKDDVIDAGEDFIDNAITGVENKETDLCDAIEAVAKAAKDAVLTDDIKSGFKTAGSNVVSGFVSGIDANKHKATSAGRSLGLAALEAAKKALDEHSPSKAFYEVGEFAGIGLVNALYDYERKTYEAGYGMGEKAKIGLSDAISKVRSVIENGIDTQPTIRPVLDLSDITAGANTMSRMLDMRSSVGTSVRFGAISSMMSNRQNGSNADVISAIKDLGSKIGEHSGDTYNVGDLTYDDGSNVSNAVRDLVHAVKMERRT